MNQHEEFDNLSGNETVLVHVYESTRQISHYQDPVSKRFIYIPREAVVNMRKKRPELSSVSFDQESLDEADSIIQNPLVNGVEYHGSKQLSRIVIDVMIENAKKSQEARIALSNSVRVVDDFFKQTQP